MRSRKPKPQVWSWADILNSTGFTDAALRRQLQRGQAKLQTAAGDGRSQATIWDIAILRVARHLGDLGFEANRAFPLAKLAVEDAYKALIGGSADFSAWTGEQQSFLYLVAARAQPSPGGVRIIRVDPDDPESGLKELGLTVSGPSNIVVPIHMLILDAWYSLPNLPDHVAAWLRASRAKMVALTGEEAA